ncbi:hypothetical protein CERSUDRAFT_118458 [Gelatoporia subvermispora B]|uniref:C2H2-type domain-containing protein n=1 Tax=Ceriporiopsis subvermispora (strain B) TaxID=914234 RepID=M2PAY0_CERS8|nr:hypothetical protein CERSUDRAFT_118458 [Gelatoporia subvermispora B]
MAEPILDIPMVDVNEDEEDYSYEDGEEYDYEDGDDVEAEAEEMARRLSEQLRADIAKAQLEAAASRPAPLTAIQPNQHPIPGPSVTAASTLKKKKEAAITTMRSILDIALNNPLVRDTLSSTLPSGDIENVFSIFQRCISVGTISKRMAKPLSEAIVSLAKSDALFGSLRNSDAPAQQLDKGKRKREEYASETLPDTRLVKRPAFDQPDLLGQISAAVRAISHALSTPPRQPPDPALVASIQLPLHQVFLFAVTSSPRAGPHAGTLHELGGLIQMLGVLSGVPIGPPAPPPMHGAQWPPYAAPPPDIGTAVHPCLVPGCRKTFHRLFSLRTHQRAHTLSERPFRCAHCPASFVRNHDLKRHARLHERRAWRCAGCDKIFSRRDAIKRHKDTRGRAAGGGKGRSGEAEADGDACALAAIEEVEVDRAEGEEEASRRAKLWNGIAATQQPAPPLLHGQLYDDGLPEEGEVNPAVIEQAHALVLQVHGLLQAHVARGLGTPVTPHAPGVPHAPAPLAQPLPTHPSAGPATFASIMASAQQSPASPAPPVPAPVPTPTTQPSTPAAQPGGLPVPISAAEALPAPENTAGDAGASASSLPASLSLAWLSEEQTRLLEQAIAQAASAAQAQAEAEAALEESSDFDDDEEVDELYDES